MARMSTEVVGASKGAVTTQGGRVLTSPNAERVLIAVDNSSSMDIVDDMLEGRTRSEAAYDAYIALLDVTDYDACNFSVVLWNTYLEHLVDLTKDYLTLANIPRFVPSGGTYMGLPIQHALSYNIQRIILLTDGETSDTHTVRQLAMDCVANGIKIDTIGIGEHDAELLLWLAETTGGIYRSPASYQELLDCFVQLETHNRLLLEHK